MTFTVQGKVVVVTFGLANCSQNRCCRCGVTIYFKVWWVWHCNLKQTSTKLRPLDHCNTIIHTTLYINIYYKSTINGAEISYPSGVHPRFSVGFVLLKGYI